MVFRGKIRTSTDLLWLNLGKLDLLWGLASPFLALLIRDDSAFSKGQQKELLVYIGVSAVTTGLSFIRFRVSHRVSGFFSVHDAAAVFWASAVGLISAVVVCFLWNRLDGIPRSVPVLHFIILTSGNIAARLFRYHRRRRRDRPTATPVNVENLLLVGASNLAWYYIQIIDDLMPDVYHIVAILDDRRKLQSRYIHGYAVAGRISDIEAVIAEYAVHGIKIHRVILGVTRDALGNVRYGKILSAAQKFNLEITDLVDQFGLQKLRRSGTAKSISQAPVQDKRAFFWQMKRMFDLVMSITALLLCSPAALIIAPLVALDCGLPVYFWQMRVGRNGKRIAVYKFRTLKAPYSRKGESISEEERMSWFGLALRRTHLDELPQLLSVMRGNMSLIGPRPLLPVDLSVKPALRFAIRPGITGWAQINGGTLVSAEEKNALDEWYIRHASVGLECRILLGTLRALFFPMKRNEVAIEAALREQALNPPHIGDPQLGDPQCNSG
jgi:lipopolysaccharide/colanic/teichoic acid biosynthesis glycosyltransferase